MLSPIADDKFCSNFANDNHFVVVSVDYPKAPLHPYPEPVQAVTDLVKAILDDQSLPIDKKKVAIGGFSAGANLSLAAVQADDLHHRIGGVVAFYPPVDFTTPTAVSVASRPQHAPPDPLEPSIGMFNWGYLNTDQDLRDPQLSVRYAPRNKLPSKLYIVGCEFDLLCRNAELMAEELASVGTGQSTGTDTCWDKNGVKWEKIIGEEHGTPIALCELDM